VDTEEKAYFLGLLYADGYNNTNKGYFELSLAESDGDVLCGLLDIFQPGRPLQFVEKKGESHQNQLRVSVTSKRLSSSLKKLGCVKAKTFKIKFPAWLRDDLVRHFIRGYFDGDGCLCIRYLENTRPQAHLSFTGNKDFCLGLRKVLSVKSSIHARQPGRNNSNRTLTMTNKAQIVGILDWLYFDAVVYFERKYKKYLELKDIVKKEEKLK
jgi:intein/homing endonuclease